MSNKETILVTGSGGFIGGWIVEMIHLSRFADVRAGIRSWAGAARLSRFPVEIVLCDVLDKESIARAMEGVSRVIHCVSGSGEAIVQGTANILDAAMAQGVRRFVHLSTTEVYGNANGNIDETFPLRSMGSPYGDAKIEAEELCWDRYRKGLPVTVVRPPIVYGPFSRDWTVGFVQRLQSGNWGIFKGYGEGICNPVYVADLVSGILLAVRHERAVGEAFNLAGPETMTWNQYFKRFNAALGFPELSMIDPAKARMRAAVMDPARSLGKFVLKHYNAPLRKMSQKYRLARRLMQYTDKTMKTTARVTELSLYDRKAFFLINKAQDILGYRPAIGIERGLDLSVRWLKNVGLVE